MGERRSDGNVCSKAYSISGTALYPLTQPTAREPPQTHNPRGERAARVLALMGGLVLYVIVVVAEAVFYRESGEWRNAARAGELAVLLGFGTDSVVRARTTVVAAVDIGLVLFCIACIVLGWSGVPEPEFLKIALVLSAFPLSYRLLQLAPDLSKPPSITPDKFTLLLSRLDAIAQSPADGLQSKGVSDDLQSCMCEIRLFLGLATTESKGRSCDDEQKSLTQIFPDVTNVETNCVNGDVSEDTGKEFLDVDLFTYNIFSLRESTNNHPLLSLSHFLLIHSRLHQSAHIPSQPLLVLLSSLEALYKPLPYHSATHAADVLQAMHCFIVCGHGERSVTGTEEAVAYIAAAAHDVGHPGVNNAFLVNTRGELAVLYNDKSVLENYHAATLFSLMKKESAAIFEGYTAEEYKTVRGYLLDMILSTDISTHFRLLEDVKAKVGGEKLEKGDKGVYLSFLLHSADISNPTRTWDLTYAWCDLIIQEYFAQGDEELKLGIPIGALNDRRTLNIPKSQIGFIDFIVQPTFLLLQELLPCTSVCMDNLKENRKKWQDRVCG